MECITCQSAMTHLTEDLYICKCGLVSSIISSDVSIYDRSYEIKYARYSGTKTGSRVLAERCAVVERYLPRNSPSTWWKLLDFGCGSGNFLNSLEGIDAYGFDVNPYGNYCDVSVLLDRYQIVTFWDSLEHLKDPIRIIEGFNPRLLFVCTPSTDDFHLGREHLTKWRHYMPQEHCHYFNEKSLTALLEKCGYDILEVNYNESIPRAGGGDKNILTVAAARRPDGKD
jgi:hypothetical protein